MNYLALLFAALGGIFMGSYPVPIKAPSVLAANVHPVVFQCYKSGCVFVSGWLFLIPRALTTDGRASLFEFTPWGLLSAGAWIPSGLTTIFSVPILGVGMAVGLSAGSSSVLSFLVFWLVMGERVERHSCGGGCTFYLAPVYLALCVAGMFGMALLPNAKLPWGLSNGGGDGGSGNGRGKLLSSADVSRNMLHGSGSDSDEEEEEQEEDEEGGSPGHGKGARASRRLHTLGLLAATMTGVFSAVQYGAVTAGRKYEQSLAGCAGDTGACPPVLKEQFDNFGSWMTSFGIGALLAAGVALLVLVARNGCCRGGGGGSLSLVPDFHWKVMRGPGLLAGSLWVLGNFFSTAAVVAGGNAVVMAQVVGFQMVTSGAWGIFYYRETRGWNAVAWGAAAFLTLVCMVLLGFEKVKS
jgi:hypothetical protein